MEKIRQITKIDIVGSRVIELGDLINEVPIAVFEDKSIELNSGAIESLYLAKDEEGNLLVSIERCSCIVFYRNIDIEKEITEKILSFNDVINDIPPLEEHPDDIRTGIPSNLRNEEIEDLEPLED